MNEYKFIEWVNNGILVTIQYKHLFNPYRVVWYADISMIGKYGQQLHEIDWKDSWIEAYNDAEEKIKTL